MRRAVSASAPLVLLLLLMITCSESARASYSRHSGFATNTSVNASVFFRVTLWTWEVENGAYGAKNSSPGTEPISYLAANISLFINPGTTTNVSNAPPYEVHAVWDVATLDPSTQTVAFPSVFDPASDLEQFLLNFKALLGNTSCLVGTLKPDGSMVVVLGDAFPLIDLARDEADPTVPIALPVPCLLRTSIDHERTAAFSLSLNIRGAFNTLAEIFLNSSASTFASSLSPSAELDCAVFPVTVNVTSGELQIGNDIATSCLTLAFQRVMEEQALVRLIFMSPTKLIVFPQRGSKVVASEVDIVNSPVLLTEATVYCGNYGNTPFIKMSVIATSGGAALSSTLRANFDVASSGYSMRVDNVSFVIEPVMQKYLILANRSEVASLQFLSLIGSVGRSPWIELQRDDMTDSFWVTLSIGAFALTRCG